MQVLVREDAMPARQVAQPRDLEEAVADGDEVGLEGAAALRWRPLSPWWERVA